MEKENKILEFDGFDYKGNPTGKKVKICIHQDKECDWQSPFGDGAFLTCWNDDGCIYRNISKDNI